MPSSKRPKDDFLATYLIDRQLFAHASAYDVNSKSDRLRSCGDLTEFFFQLVRVLQPDLFIEAGAKDGASSRYARRFLKDSRIVAFEANPFTFERFEPTFRKGKSNVEYLNLALSNEAGEIAFNVNVAADGSPRADGQGSLMAFGGDKSDFAGTVEVTAKATTMDDFFPAQSFNSCALWVDVEGASEMVLTGGHETLQKADVVIIEVEDRAYWDGQWLRSDVVNYLLDHGLVPVSRDFQSRYLYNLVFVRYDKLEVDRVRWALTHHLSRSGHPVEDGPSGMPSSETAVDEYAQQMSQKELASQFAANLKMGIKSLRD